METNSALTLRDGSSRDEADLKLSLACPRCGTAGWTGLQGLKRGMRCPRCQCQFLVDSTGRFLTEDQLHRVRYTCPRCRQSGSIPARLNVRKAVCGACQLTLAAGPDQRLYGEKEAAAMRRAASLAAGQLRLRERLAARLTTDDGRLHWFNVSVSALLLGGILIFSAVVLSRLLDSSVESGVCQFTYTCLTGDWDEAHGYLPDDAVQRAEFDRWRVRYFSSILDKFRPAGDAIEIVAAMVSNEPSRRVFRVTLKSPYIGTRGHDQHWRFDGRTWRFDPQGTLAATDGVFVPRPRK